VQVEGVQLEQTRIVWRGTADRQLKMQIRDGRSPALTVDALTVGLRGVALLLPEVEAGTYTIYGCGPAGRGYDLDRLGETLAQQPAPRVMAGSPVLNQDWSRGLVADGLAAPVPRVAKWSFSETLEVQAEPGLVRVPLPVSVKAGTRDGLPDLRFETPGGEVVPHVVEHIGSERVVGVRWRQEEIGNLTRLHLVLPESNLHVERLVLRAERARFLRKVHLKANGLTLVTAEWSGTGEVESRLVVDLDRRVPREIWVELDNRDSMPLPLLEPELTTPAWEARLIAPQTGVDLRYGSTTMRRPSFDLELVRAQVLDSPAAEASLMRPAPPPVVRRPSSPTPLLSEPRGSRWVLLAIAILAIVMGGLAMRLSTEADQEDELLR